jgi:hypothetical protein
MKLLLPLAASIALATSADVSAQASTVLYETFENIAPSGWTVKNVDYSTRTENPGYPSWFQGNPEVFSAHSGTAGSYFASDKTAIVPTAEAPVTFLISPAFEIPYNASTVTLSFYTRRSDEGTPGGDWLLVNYLGAQWNPVYDSNLLGYIGDNQHPYPTEWTKYTYQLPASPGSSLRIALMYGLTTESSYIGVDTLSVTINAVPEPSAWLMLAGGLAGLGVLARRRR